MTVIVTLDSCAGGDPAGQVAAELTCDVLAVDGATVHVRPIRPDDGARLVAFHAHLSPETVYRRFFLVHPVLSAVEVEHLTNVDYHDRLALVAEHAGGLVAVARYDRIPASSVAEVAFVANDSDQGRGLGTLLLEHLAAAARSREITGFVADVLVANADMLGVFARAGFIATQRHDDGVVRVEFSIEPTEAYVAAVEARDHLAERHSMEHLLRPAGVAVVGVSARPGGVGHAIFSNIVEGGYAGDLYPVNRRGATVLGRPGFRSIADLPGPVELVVVAIAPEDAIALVADAARQGARTLLVISAGFAEVGPVGATLQRRLLKAARDYGIRVVGPNCLGLANTAPGVSLNATFAPTAPVAGPTGLLTQSGAVGIVALEQAARIGLGISSFVSVGNKADVSGNDLLEFWQDDPATEVVCLYLESFGNPRRFGRLAERLSRTKPVVVLKSGRTDAGRRAATSHTAAAASSDVAVDALCARAGVIRVRTLTELFDTAVVLADQPVPAGRRTCVVGNSGGPGILAADACGLAGLEVPELSRETQDALRGFLPASAAVANPVDLLAAATGTQYERALDLVLADPRIDAVIAVYTPPLVSEPDDIAAAVAAAAGRAVKPIVACFLGSEAPPHPLRHPPAGGRNVPCLPVPERAADALARACAYGDWRARPVGAEPHLDGIDQPAARMIVLEALARPLGGGWLDAEDAWALLASYGFSVVPTIVAPSEDEAVAAARVVGYPVALKAAAGTIVHKSDFGGVHLGLADATAVRDAFRAMVAALGQRMGGATVQPMAGIGVETIVGVINDESFGPLVMFGLGGIATDLLADRAFRSPPISDVDASVLVRSLRSSPLLTGYRGSEPVDLAALEDIVLRAGRLAQEIPELAELDLNPIVVNPTGALVLDVKVRLIAPPGGPNPWLLRQTR